jgi:hypothetical protein
MLIIAIAWLPSLLQHLGVTQGIDCKLLAGGFSSAGA